jgi:hypothetical protein
MIRQSIAVAAAALAVSLSATPALADRTQFNAKDVIVPQPGMAYIYYRSDVKGMAAFLRTVDEAQHADFVAKRAAAFAKAHEKYLRKKATWDKTPVEQRVGEAPEEPTDATFAFPAPELDNFVSVNPGRVVVDQKSNYAYLLMVKPGEYTYYGAVSLGYAAVGGTCMCMGSVRFEVKADQIVDLGKFTAVFKDPDQAGGALPDKTELVSHVALLPGATTSQFAVNLPKLPVVPAVYHAAYKMPNYHGVNIDRLLPVPGVLGYKRDEVIDLSTAPK